MNVSVFLSFFHYVGKRTMNVISNPGGIVIFFYAFFSEDLSTKTDP